MRNLSNRGKYLRANLASTILNAALFYHETFSKHTLCPLLEMRKEGGGVANEYVMYSI